MELDVIKIREETKEHLARNKVILITLFFFSALGLYIIIHNAPEFRPEEKEIIFRMPSSAERLYELSEVINKYTEKSYYYVVFMVCYTYTMLQSFVLPGAPFLSVLCGAIFGLVKGLSIVTVCHTLGALVSYILIETLGKGIAIRCFPNKILSMNKRINNHRHNLVYYMSSIRVVPFIPKWLVTIASPIIGVPLDTFIITAIVGLTPHNTIHVMAGIKIASAEGIGLSFTSLLILLSIALLFMIPTFFNKKEEDISDKDN